MAFRYGRISAVLITTTMVAGLLLWATHTPAQAAGETVTVHAAQGSTTLRAIACPNATDCVAVGETASSGVVVPVVNGVPQAATAVAGTTFLTGIACYTGGGCVAVGDQSQGAPSYQNTGVIVAISSTGAVGAAQTIANSESFGSVACEPTTTTCIAVGRGSVIAITSGTAGALQSVDASLEDVACPSATLCEAIGETNAASPVGQALAITSGTAGTLVPITGTTYMLSLACPSANTCEAVGAGLPGQSFDNATGVAVTLTDGAPGAVHSVPEVQEFQSVACSSASACLTTGGVFNGAQTRSITAIDNGVPGTPQPAPVFVGESPGQLIACASATKCFGVGYSGPDRSEVGQVIPVAAETVQTAIPATGTEFLFGIACPSLTRCIAVGTTTGFASGAVVDIAIPAETTTTSTPTTTPPGSTPPEITTGAGAGGGPHVRSFSASGSPLSTSFYAYAPTFSGGVPVARGDLNGDGVNEIVVGSGDGGSVFSVFDSNGGFRFARSPFGDFRGGVDVAVGDVVGDATPEIIVAAGPGGGPHVRLYSATGDAIGTGFFAFEPDFRGGVHVAVGALGGSKSLIIAGAGAGGNPAVHVLDGAGAFAGPGGFFAYDTAFRGGVYVAAGDVNGDGVDEIITGAGAGGGPHVRVFNATATPVAGWFAYTPSFAGGVRVGAGNLNGDRRDEVTTGAGPGGGPHVKAFSGDGGSLLESFYAYGPDFHGGVYVAATP